jgi:hypothetical protein
LLNAVERTGTVASSPKAAPRPPGRFCIRVITAAGVASLHVDDKHTKIEQYH